jgi:hypothetical protein
MSEAPRAADGHTAFSTAGTLALARKAAQDGAASAREAANRTVAATSQFASWFAYTTCYAASYGVVFPVIFCARAIPHNNAAVRGLIDGTGAAKHRVDQIITRSRAKASSRPARVWRGRRGAPRAATKARTKRSR